MDTDCHYGCRTAISMTLYGSRRETSRLRDHQVASCWSARLSSVKRRFGMWEIMPNAFRPIRNVRQVKFGLREMTR
jgi:hypothetical protein